MAGKRIRKATRNITMDDIEYVYKHYGEKTFKQMSAELGLTVVQITRIVRELRQRGVELKRKPRRKLFDEFVEKLKKGE